MTPKQPAQARPAAAAAGSAGAPGRRAAVWRTDLLGALHAAGGDAAAEARLSALLGFVPKPEALPRLPVGDGDAELPMPLRPPPPLLPAVPAAADRPQAALPAVVRWQNLPPPGPSPFAGPGTQAGPAPHSAGPATAPEAGPFDPQATPPARIPLLRNTQLWPALARAVQLPRVAGTDVPALLRQLGQGRQVRRLPRLQRRIWGGDLWVVLDRSPHLQPFADDALQLVRLLVRLRGQAGLVLWAVSGSPDRPLGPPAGTAHASALGARWPSPPPGASVLLLSDLGSLSPQASAEAPWLDFARHLQRAGTAPVAWLPAAPAQVSRSLATAVQAHCLQPGAALKRQQGRLARPAQRDAEHQRLQHLLTDLQAMASCCVRLDLPLLRALRLAHPQLRREPALESLYWADPQHASPSLASRTLRPEPAAEARQRFATLPAELQRAALQVLHQHHAGQPRSTLAVEMSLWLAHAGAGIAAGLPPALATRLGAAQQWLHSLGQHAAASATPSAGLTHYALDLLHRQRADGVWQPQCANALAALWASTGSATLPAHVPAAALLLARQARTGSARSDWLLLQRGADLWLWPAAHPVPRHASVMAGPLRSSAVLVKPAKGQRRLHQPDAGLQAGASLLRLAAHDLPAELAFDEAVLTVDVPARPAWALEWGRDKAGLYALAPTPWGKAARLRQVVGEQFTLAASADELPLPATPAAGTVSGTAAAAVQPVQVRVFCAQATEDRALRATLMVALRQALDPKRAAVSAGESPVQPSFVVGEQVWHRPAGLALQVLLLSPHLLRSTRWYKTILPALQADLDQGGARVLPVCLPGMKGSDLPPALARLQVLRMQEGGDRGMPAVVQAVVQAVAAMQPGRGPAAAPSTPAVRWELGADAAFGLYSSLTINGITQRLRWLPPGSFWMGSTDTERARLHDRSAERWARNETGRHQVHLTEGLWLADTACTQALWLAVMGGENPSRFKDDLQSPVEQVSWDDVQQFLQRLQPLLPLGCQAALPTEAEWEYACRAGTDTTFSFGDNISPEQVNFDGSLPFDGASHGAYRKRTVVVASLPPNSWGLYEMHGNVWEWCADGQRPYAGGDATDPIGPIDQGPDGQRSVRGGAWYDFAKGARSADRRTDRRTVRFDFLGFRFALRSSSTSPGLLTPKGPEGIGPGKGAEPAARGAQHGSAAGEADAGERPGLLDSARRWLGRVAGAPSAPPTPLDSPKPDKPTKPPRRRP